MKKEENKSNEDEKIECFKEPEEDVDDVAEKVELCGKCNKPKGERETGFCLCGRPGKYYKEIIDDMFEYFNRQLTKIETKKCTTKTGGTFWLDDVIANDFPTFEQFSTLYPFVAIKTMQSWTREKTKDGKRLRYKKFSEAYAICKQLQKDFLIKNGITGKLQPQMAKLIGINLAGLRDEKSITHKGDEENPVVTKEQKPTRDLSDEELQEELEKRMRDNKPENKK